MPNQHPHVSLCQLSLPFTSFDEDVALAVAAGASGLGLDERKLAGPGADLAAQGRRLAESGLAATICAASVLTILPRDPARDTGPRAPAERIEAIAAGTEKLASVGAECVLCATGPAGAFPAHEARAIVIEGFRAIAARASAAGTRLAIEPMRESFRPLWTLVCGLEETAELLGEIGRDDVGIVFDTWHLWDSPDVRTWIPKVIDRIDGVQIADYRNPTRGIRDRVAAGEGVADIRGLVVALRDAGYDGWYDMEVFSDLEFEDSLWKLPPLAFAERQITGFLTCAAGLEAPRDAGPKRRSRAPLQGGAT